MFDNIIKFFKKFSKEEKKDSKDTAKERLHLVLMQDRANVSADFMELMKQEIIEVIKKYIDVDENSIDVKLTNKVNSDGTTGAPILYANIPILNVKDDTKQINIERKLDKKEPAKKEIKEEPKKEEVVEEVVEEASKENAEKLEEPATENGKIEEVANTEKEDVTTQEENEEKENEEEQIEDEQVTNEQEIVEESKGEAENIEQTEVKG